MNKLTLAALAAALAAACSNPASAPSTATPTPTPSATATAETSDYPLAPSYTAHTPCPDDGPRLPLSGVCAGRATAYMTPDDSTPTEAPAGCEWGVNEVWFGGDVLLYRALSCGDKKVVLEYAGGAHAAELSYTSSVLHPEAVPNAADPMANHPIVRIATYETNDDFRLKETIGSDADIATCEIKPAGAGYPTGAKLIAPRSATANCGLYAVSATADNFWVVRPQWVFTFMLPKGPRDIDPSSFSVVTPQ